MGKKNCIIKLDNISKYYTTGDTVTLGLRKVNLELHKGEFIAVTGESGSGKSTLINVLSGIDTYEEGVMYFKDKDTSGYTIAEWDEYRMQNIAFIFQDYSLIDSYTVLQNVELALTNVYPDKEARRERAKGIIEKVGLSSHIKHKCTKLSGGQKQRVAIARALAKDSPIILADEPTGNLDSKNSEQIISLLADIAEEKLVIVVTHNYEDVEKHATRKIRLFDGAIVEDIDCSTRRKEQGDFKPLLVLDRNQLGIRKKTEKKAFMKIALDNLIATPKRTSFFLTTSIFVLILLSITFLAIMTNITNGDIFGVGDRRDTIFILEDAGNIISDDKITQIENIAEVKTTMAVYDAYNVDYVFEEASEIWKKNDASYNAYFRLLTTENFDRKKPLYGEFPDAEGEILIGYAEKGIDADKIIGSTVTMVQNSYRHNYGYSYYGYEETEIFSQDFIVTGIDVGPCCYVTPAQLELTSKDVRISGVNNVTTIFNDNYNNYNVMVDEDIPAGTAYLIFKNSEDILEVFEDYFVPDLQKELEDNGGMATAMISLQESSINHEVDIYAYNDTIPEAIFDKYEYIYEADFLMYNPILIISKTSPLFESQETQIVLAVIDDETNMEELKEEILSLGLKYVYPYQASIDIYEKIMIVITGTVLVIIGIIVLIIAASLLGFVFSRISASKVKDYSILRTVGFSAKQIRFINYLELIYINLFSILSVMILFLILIAITQITAIPKFIIIMYKIVPKGVFHSSSLYAYLGIFVGEFVLTAFIARAYNKRMKIMSVKTSMVKEALEG